MVFSGRCCDLVQVEEWFREFGRACCAPVVLKVGWVYCVAVLDMCLLKPCYMFFMMMVISVLGSVWVGEVRGCSMG